jgi:NDP-sugar pyrophosphorylase family protein
MKALVLAGGRGKRLNDVSQDRNKCMAMYGGRYIIENSLENAARAQVDEIVLVVGYKAESIIDTFGNRYRDLPIRYVIQWERRGLVHAIECAREAIDGADFFLFLADELMKETRHEAMVDAFHADNRIFALCGIVRAEDPEQVRKTYTIFCDQRDSRIHRLVEKPRTPLSNIQGTGNCIFRNEIFDYIAHTPINQFRKEKEMPDLIQCAVDDGKLVRAFEIASWYSNINTMEEYSLRPEAAVSGT